MDTQKYGSLNPSTTAFFMCDIQEKFRPAMLHFKEVVESASKLLQASKILGVPLIVTEQYPQGLGKTVEQLDVSHAIGVFSKTKFCMLVPEVLDALKTANNGNVSSVVLFGIEAHVCVEQTALELKAQGYQVHIVADASTSRTQEDRLLALERMKQIGCFISTRETVIFKLLGDKNNPNFSQIRPLVTNPMHPTGLIPKM
ncbi:hypothetical protein B566_EDAN012711 [Ephemera danica]|nr:hypothetical protein B566_EDAN012711 [Ephemera danica]